MKKKNLIYVIGLVITSVGFISILVAIFYDYKLQQNRSLATLAGVTYNADNTKSVNIHGEDTLVDAPKEDLDAKPHYLEVTTYKNVLQIPKISVLVVIGKGTSKEVLAQGVGWHETTVKPGQKGNSVIAGHSSDTYACIFNDLNTMQLLDSFYVFDDTGKRHVYYVTEKYITQANNTGVLANTDTSKSIVTLYTCANGGADRLILVGKELSDAEVDSLKTTLLKDKKAIMQSINETIEIDQLEEVLLSDIQSN